MLTIIGLSIIFVIVILLLTEKVSPVICLILVPLIGAIIAGFDLETISKYFTSGIASVMQVAIMFVFAILFFGIMNDVGLFDPLIKGMIRLTRGNVIAVTVGTVLISIVAQLDGAGASTFLLVVPPLLPLYKKLRMNPYVLFLLLAASAGLINMLPWGGPIGRVAAVLEMDARDLWIGLIPVQIVGVVLILGLAVIMGILETRRIRKTDAQLITTGTVNFKEDLDTSLGVQGDEAAVAYDFSEEQLDENRQSLLRPKLFWVNAVLFIAILVVLVMGLLPAGYIFMIGLSVALLINYPQPAAQIERISAHSGGAIMMASIILAAGSFLGILRESGMLIAIANQLVNILPSSLLPHLHIIIGMIGVPLELVLNTDAYYLALFPVVEQITTQAGVASTSAAYAMVIGSIVGTFVSPFSPALWMGLGLAKLSMGKHIKFSFFWIWGLSVLLLLISIVMGTVQ